MRMNLRVVAGLFVGAVVAVCAMSPQDAWSVVAEGGSGSGCKAPAVAGTCGTTSSGCAIATSGCSVTNNALLCRQDNACAGCAHANVFCR